MTALLAICAIGQSAFKSGINTFFSGFNILALSPINLTPANTIISASVFLAFFAKAYESPTKSATSCTAPST